VLASRAQIETVLSAGQAEGSRGIARRTMPLPGFASPGWDIGMAVKENSRNLGDALEGLLGAMAASGELKAIFARHGVTWTRRWPPEQGPQAATQGPIVRPHRDHNLCIKAPVRRQKQDREQDDDERTFETFHDSYGRDRAGHHRRAPSGPDRYTCAGAPAPGAGPTDAQLMDDAASTGDVLTYGMGPRAQRFSPYPDQRGQCRASGPRLRRLAGRRKQRGQEAQPLVYDGTIYVTGSYSRLFAFDARTGEQKWKYEARLPDGIMPCCDVVNRGAAIYGDKIIFATLDARLVALNRHTGKVVWNKQIADYQAGYSATAAADRAWHGHHRQFGRRIRHRGRGGGPRRQHRRADLAPPGGRGQHGHLAWQGQWHHRQAERHLGRRPVEDRRRRDMAGRDL
jgi:hypothetical protein